MDTYFKIDSSKCIGCKACTEVCIALEWYEGRYGGRVDYIYDNCSCHHCHDNVNTPSCLVVCPNDCLDYERW